VWWEADMRVMFGITLAIVAVGLAYFMVVGLLKR
jgi:hypothetical protein